MCTHVQVAREARGHGSTRRGTYRQSQCDAGNGILVSTKATCIPYSRDVTPAP